MTTDDPRFDDHDLDELALDELGLADVLADPDLWADPEPGDADAIVALIAAEAAATTPAEAATAPADTATASPDAATAPVVDLAERRRARAGLGQTLLTAAAGALLALVAWNVVAAVAGGAGDGGVDLALEGTELAPSASADVTVVVGTLGTRIDLDVSGLEPAPEGFYYEAWLRQSPEVGVSAGTFHLRGGDGSVELWAGVDPADYPLLTVTLQPEGLADSSGQVVLKGTVAQE